MKDIKLSQAVKILKKGGIGVLPTDTIYGIVGIALSPKTVKRIYSARERNPSKPMIILISSLNDLVKFSVRADKKTAGIIQKFWPGKVSIILPCKNDKFRYLHRGTNSLAFRLPKNRKLINLIKKTGPLVAPSANPEGNPPATSIRTAKKYFGEKIDFYVDGGSLKSEPSALIKIISGETKVLRGRPLHL